MGIKFPCSGTGVTFAGGVIQYHKEIELRSGGDIVLTPLGQVFIDQNSDQRGLHIDSEAVSKEVVRFKGKVQSGRFAYFGNMPVAATTIPMVVMECGAAHHGEVLRIRPTGSGAGIIVNHDGTGDICFKAQDSALDTFLISKKGISENLAKPADATTTTRDSPPHTWAGTYWDGTSSKYVEARFRNVVTSTAPDNYLWLDIDGVDVVRFHRSGDLELPASGKIKRDKGDLELKTITSGNVKLTPVDQVEIRRPSGNCNVGIDSGKGTTYSSSGITLKHDGLNRWMIIKKDDATGNLRFIRCNDAGAAISDSIQLVRADGKILCFGTIEVKNHLMPETDNTENMGSPTLRFKSIHGVNIYSGDYCFQNGWKLTEKGDGIALVRPNGSIAKEWN